MYNFHKQKNEFGYQEFMHPLFKKGAVHELKNIPRKITANYKLTKSLSIKKIEGTNAFNNYFKTQLKKANSLLRVVSTQNKRLVRLNQKMLKKFKYEKYSQLTIFSKLALVFYESFDNEVNNDRSQYIEDLVRNFQVDMDQLVTQKSSGGGTSSHKGGKSTKIQLYELVDYLFKRAFQRKLKKANYVETSLLCSNKQSKVATECDLPKDLAAETSIELKYLGNLSLSHLEDISFDDTSCLGQNHTYDKNDFYLTFKDQDPDNNMHNLKEQLEPSYLETS